MLGTEISVGSLDDNATTAPIPGAGLLSPTVTFADCPASSAVTSDERVSGGEAGIVTVPVRDVAPYLAVDVTVCSVGDGLVATGTIVVVLPAGMVVVGGIPTRFRIGAAEGDRRATSRSIAIQTDHSR